MRQEKFMAEACMSAKEISPRDLVSTKEEKNQGGDVQARATTRIDCIGNRCLHA
jgi:hypothetical protein